MSEPEIPLEQTARCTLCGKKASQSRPLVRADLVRPSVAALVRREHSAWGAPGDAICVPELNRFRSRYIENLVAEEHGHLTTLERDVLDHMRQQALISEDTNLEFEAGLTFGERLSDKVAGFGGSWAFIITFGAFLFLWMAINSIVLLQRPFDPYPFILLNLILSTIAALQAPIIMMSQNRQEAKDRLRNEQDYRVNLKAELEIRILSERVEALVHNQWQRLLEIQEIQIDLMQELARQARKRKIPKDWKAGRTRKPALPATESPDNPATAASDDTEG